MLSLASHQVQCVDALVEGGDGSVVVVPTAGGKTRIMAEIIRRMDRDRALVLAHNHDLIRQNARSISDHCRERVGIYCAGLGERDLSRRVTSATVASMHAFLRHWPEENIDSADPVADWLRYDAAIIDEAHHVPPPTDNADMMYVALLARLKKINPALKVYGLTATPYRMTTGGICDDSNIFRSIVHSVTIEELLEIDFITPLVTQSPPLRVMDVPGVADPRYRFPHTEKIVSDIIEAKRNHGVIFASSIHHAMEIENCLVGRGETAATISHRTMAADYRNILKLYILGDIKYICNFNRWTEGVDIPFIDLIVLARSTESPGLLAQCVGRGMRKHPSKKECLVLDYGGNIERFGPINLFASTYAEAVEKRSSAKPAGTPAPNPPTRGERDLPDLDETASSLPIIATSMPDMEVKVTGWFPLRNTKVRKDGSTSVTLKVTYKTDKGNFHQYLCFEKTSHKFALKKCLEWWKKTGTSLAMPGSVLEAVQTWKYLPAPVLITVKRDGKYNMVESVRFT